MIADNLVQFLQTNEQIEIIESVKTHKLIKINAFLRVQEKHQRSNKLLLTTGIKLFCIWHIIKVFNWMP